MPEEVKPKLDYRQIAKLEYEKCAKSPEYFITKYVYIQMTNGGRGKFILYEFQKKLLHLLHTRDRLIILKSRQLGITTLSAAYALWLMIFRRDQSILALAPDQEKARNILDKIHFAYDELPGWLLKLAGAESVEKAKLRITLANGSKAVAASGASKSARGKTASFLVLDEAAFIENAEELWGSAQQTLSTGGSAIMLSCVVKDTLILTSSGIKKIEHFVNKDLELGGYEVPYYDIMGFDKPRVGNLFHNNGEVETKKIKTSYSEVESSLNHKFWAYKKSDKKFDWYEAKDLEVGDFLSIKKGSNLFGNNDTIKVNYTLSNKIINKFTDTVITEDLAYLFGLYISEGSVYIPKNKKGQPVGANLTISCGDDISGVFDRLGIHYHWDKKFHYTVSSKNLMELFKEVGFDLSRKAHEKIIPYRLLECSKPILIQILRGIFDGDGCSTNKVVNLVSSSEELIDQVRMLLLNLGITSCKYTKSVEYLNKYNSFKYEFKYPSHVLEMNGSKAYEFMTKVGFNLDRKQKNIKHFTKYAEKQKDIIVVPNTLNLVKRLVDLSGLTSYKLRYTYGINITNILNKTNTYPAENLTYYTVDRVYNMFSHLLTEEERIYWNKVLQPDIVWSEIKSIDYSKNLTYDFSLPDVEEDPWCHSVLYNGIVGHQTPNGDANLFYNLYTEAEMGDGEFTPVKLKWNVHPDRDQAWRDRQDKELGSRKMAMQECDAEFLSSGDTFIDSEVLNYVRENIEEPVETRGPTKSYWIWKYPHEVSNCVVIVDTSRGDGADSSAVQVLDLLTGDQIAELKEDLLPKDLARVAVAIATEYNGALLIVENTGIGQTTCSYVEDSGYQNVFYSPKGDTRDMHAYLDKYFDQNKEDMITGFTNSTKTRPLILAALQQALIDKLFRIRSKRLSAELGSFIWKNGKPQAAYGKHDDLVITIAIGHYLRDTAINYQSHGADITKTVLNNIKHSTQARNVQASIHNWQNPYEWANPHNGKIEDISWVL